MRASIWEARLSDLAGCAERGLNRSQSAKELGLSVATVRTYTNKFGIVWQDKDKVRAPSAFATREEKIRECAEQGMTRIEAAEHLGLCYQTIHKYCAQKNINFRHANVRASDPRSEAMAAMYRGGKTLREIGDLYGITRERVRQIMTRFHGIVGKDGGMAAKAEMRKNRRDARRNATYQAKYGCSFNEYRRFVAIGKRLMAEGRSYYRTPMGAFRCQRRNALARNIGWSLSIKAWWAIWQASGHWDKRGRGHGYMMCRFGDAGAYEVGNVYIATGVHNSAVQPNNRTRKSHPLHAEFMQARAA